MCIQSTVLRATAQGLLDPCALKVARNRDTMHTQNQRDNIFSAVPVFLILGARGPAGFLVKTAGAAGEGDAVPPSDAAVSFAAAAAAISLPFSARSLPALPAFSLAMMGLLSSPPPPAAAADALMREATAEPGLSESLPPLACDDDSLSLAAADLRAWAGARGEGCGAEELLAAPPPAAPPPLPEPADLELCTASSGVGGEKVRTREKSDLGAGD